MRKTLICILVLVSLCLGISPPAGAASYSYITDASRASGASYTDIPSLASALDGVFSGALNLYSDKGCATLVSAPLGSSKVPVGTTYYAKESGSGSVYSGSSCYIYANAVYATLFGDIPYHGSSSTWQNSHCAVQNLSSASYSLFTTYGIKFGALLRTTSNNDGSYSSNSGHSIIILDYNESGITFLEGNADGKGLIRITTRTWDSFNSVLLTSRGYVISFIVQPTEKYLASLSGNSVGNTGSGVSHSYEGYFSAIKTYDGRFWDVKSTNWYCSSIVTAYELGLMSGRSTYTFSPSGTVSVAEAATLAARLLSGYWGDSYDFTANGTSWYKPYYDYCALWGIDPTKYGSAESTISRGDFASLMAKALPSQALTAINSVPAGSISDVAAGADCYNAVYTLYRAGVLTGSGGLFRPNSTLTRSEAAAVMSRMADKALRINS